MSIVSIISIMGAASFACMVAEKIAIECGKVTHAQYISLFTSASLGITAGTSVYKLIQFISAL